MQRGRSHRSREHRFPERDTLEPEAMNRRNFLAASASAAAALVPTTSSQARTAERLKVLIPPTPAEQLSELREAAPGLN